MSDRDLVIYQVDPSLLLDSDGDGCGDLRGIGRSLHHIRWMGANTLWLLPFYRSPFRDGGYDVTDHLAIDPRFGDLADFCSLVEQAERMGLRIVVELVMQHTSIDHPWFQQARRDRNSPYRGYYIWADEPPDDGLEPIFPGVEDSVWSWDEVAGQFYRHRFYSHEPDLEIANPAVRREIYRTMACWLRLGAAGFRVDAVPYMIERARRADPRDGGRWLLKEMRDVVRQRRPDAVLIGEADVPPSHYAEYFGDRDRLTHLLDFACNNHLFLSMARGDGRPLMRTLLGHGDALARGRIAVWLRNHDELDLEQLSERQREEVMGAFAPEPGMRIYGRGIRRRLAPMLGGRQDRQATLHALLLSLPGEPVIRYGDEIGMGDNLRRRERMAVRTPMQWHAGANGGFSAAPQERLVAAPIASGPFGYPQLNVDAQRWDPDSLLGRIRGLVHARVALPEFAGTWRAVVHDRPALFALRYEDPSSGSVLLAFANLGEAEVVATVEDEDLDAFEDVIADAPYPPPSARELRVRGYGYRWLRLRRA